MSKQELALVKKDTVDVVAEKIRQFQEKGEIHLPQDYSPENAMKSAWLTLQSTLTKDKRPVLEACTRDSIANALLNMVITGLTPAKNQVYFVAYGNQLVCMRSYFGSVALIKRVANAEDVPAQVIYEGDAFEYTLEKGRIKILKHETKFQNKIKGNIVGAYAVVEFSGERPDHVELMDINQIKEAWKQGQTYDNPNVKKKTHDTFDEEMCKKTVTNRACKRFINSSNDSHLFLDAVSRTEEAIADHQAEEEIEENANKDFIDVEGTWQDEEPQEQNQEEPQEEKQEEPEPQKTGTDPGF